MIAPLILWLQTAATELGREDADCVQPVIAESLIISQTQMNDLVQRSQTYVTCMTKAIDERRELSDSLLEQARKAAQEGNAMVTEVNDFVARMRKYQERAPDR